MCIRDSGILSEQADATGMLQQEKADAVGKQCGVLNLGHCLVQTQCQQGILAGLQGRQEPLIEFAIKLAGPVSYTHLTLPTSDLV